MTKTSTERNVDPTPGDFIAVLRRDGLLRHSSARLTPLGGGVSSEIYRFEDSGNLGKDDLDRTLVFKRSMIRIYVKEDWSAVLS
ncbi:MAG: hypothetical protein ACRD3Y_10760, partial [Bryobacteraceae bacterium]